MTHESNLPLLSLLHFCVPPHSHGFGVVAVVQSQPSFGLLLQLASLPGTQVSDAAGATTPVQEPHEVEDLSADKLQFRVPALQLPVLFPGQAAPDMPAGQAQVESWLSGRPLKSLSAVDVQSRGFAVISRFKINQLVFDEIILEVWVCDHILCTPLR